MALPAGPSRGYETRAYVSNAPGAFYIVYPGDFGASLPGQPTLTYEASSGSFASETVYVQITWITAEGESLPSAEKGVQVTSAQGAVLVAQPTVPVNGQTVVGWRVYDATTSGHEALVVAANSYTAQSTIDGIANAYPVATTNVYLKNASASSVIPPAVDDSGIQPALVSVGANTTVDEVIIVPNTGSQWKVQKNVELMRTDGVADPAGLIFQHADCEQPSYASLTGGATYTSSAISAGAYAVLNGYLFVASVGGNTASAFIGFSAFNLAKGATTTDGTVTWQSLGKSALIKLRFANASATPAIPAAQTYTLFEL